MPQPHFQHSTPPYRSLSSPVTMNFWIDDCVNIWVLISATFVAFAVGGLLILSINFCFSHPKMAFFNNAPTPLPALNASPVVS